MGSAYQFPQSLSLSEFSKVRDPSFSSYLNDADVRHEAKQGRADGEIGVFRADKYFSEELESAEKPKESALRRSAVDMVSSPVRSKISLGTPSIRSETSSRNSKTSLLQSFPNQVLPGRRRTVEVQRKKGFLSRICCKCSCVNKKSLDVEDRHFNSKEERRGSNMNRSDELLQVNAAPPGKPWTKGSNMVLYPSVTPSLLGEAISSPVLSINTSQNLRQSVKIRSQDSLSPPATGNTRKSISLERKLNLSNRDNLNTRLDIESTVSVEYDTDAESDASSDLFEIDSFTGQRKPSFSSHIHDSSASGYATPTTGYAPSEASIDWSGVTASALWIAKTSNFQSLYPLPKATDKQSLRKY